MAVITSVWVRQLDPVIFILHRYRTYVTPKSFKAWAMLDLFVASKKAAAGCSPTCNLLFIITTLKEFFDEEFVKEASFKAPISPRKLRILNP